MKFKKNWMRFWTLNRHHAEGFTLVELIVVIAILAILGGIAVPAYSGYVEKAKRAADEQLLAAVNTAFAAACAVNGTDHYNVASVPSFDMEAMSINTGHPYKADFDAFFKGADGTFEVIKALYYSSEVGSFLELPSEYVALLGILDPTDIAKLQASGFITAEGLGVANLMDKVAFVSALAASFGDSEAIGSYMMACLPDLAAAMGYDITTEEGEAAFNEKWNSMVAARAELVDTSSIEGYDQMTEEEKLAARTQLATYEVAANNLVLQAAGNLPADSTTVLADLAKTENFVDLIKNEENGLTNAAMAYGLYTAYAYGLPEGADRDAAIAKTNDPLTLLKAMDDPGFRTYLENEDGQAQKDLDGYLASMNMINDAQKDSAAVEEVLVNGFNDDALIGLLQQAANSTNSAE